MTSPTRYMHNPTMVADQLHAFRTWDHDANLPDVISRADFCARPDLVAAVLQSRHSLGRGGEPLLVLPYPKDDGTHRTTCLLDPFDDVGYALLVSNIGHLVEAALPSDRVVQSTRFHAVGQAYGAEGWRRASLRRGSTVDQSSTSGVGGFDVRNHFDSVSPDLIRLVLHTCRVSDGASEEVARFIEQCGAWPSSPNGLPAGPMASALLGTVALLPVDRLLRRLGVDYERWMDDFIVAAETEARFLTLKESVADLLRLNGQELNASKDWYEEPNNSHQASLGDVGESDSETNEWGDPSISALIDAIESSDPKRCRFVLGGLRARVDESAVALVAGSDQIWAIAPKYAADYLLACRTALAQEHLEVMSERCATTPRQSSAAGIAHCARTLAHRRIPSELGKLLYEAAERISTGPYRAAAPFLYNAASVSKEKARTRCERAIETASAVSDVLSARGLIAGLRYDTRSRRVEAGLKALARCRPDLAPTVAWIGA